MQSLARPAFGCLIVFATFGLAACENPSSGLRAGVVGVPIDRENLVFYDADTFDVGLSEAMAEQPNEVHLAFAAPTSLDKLPPRVGNWLSAVQNSDGKVTTLDVQPPDATSSKRFIGLGDVVEGFKFVIALWDYHKAAMMFGQANQFNAVIVYDGHTGLAREIVFRKRGLTT